MRKGLTLTLMTVAIAMIGVQANAMAPTISDIPSPIVGSFETMTQGQKYIFADAIDLDAKVADDTTPDASLLWSFTGGSHYLINGIAPINVGTTDPTSPTTAQIINRNDKDPVTGTDGKKNTITIRNKILSPLLANGQPGVDVPPSATGIVAAETQAVTLFCSDGSAYSSKTLVFYTDNGGRDRLSEPAAQWTLVKRGTVTSTAQLWRQNPDEWISGGGISTSLYAGQGGGQCLTTPQAGSNMFSVISTMPYWQLADNTVYRFTMKMISTQTAAGTVPLWDMVVENWDGTTLTGMNSYSMDASFYDNVGGADAVKTTSVNIIQYWVPAAAGTTQWAGLFNAAYEAHNDPRLRFRITDFDSIGQGANRLGSVCLQEMLIESLPLGSIKAKSGVAPLVNITSMAQAGSAGGNCEVVSYFNAAVAFSGGAVQVTPVGQGQTLEVAEIRPATDTVFGNPVAPFTSFADNWPIAWQSNKLLRMQVGLSAPNTTAENKPWDAYQLTFQAATDEVNYDSYVTSREKFGSPRVGTPQTYTALYWTNTKTLASESQFASLRWRVSFMNSGAANFPSNTTADAANTGTSSVHSVKVEECDVPQ